MLGMTDELYWAIAALLHAILEHAQRGEIPQKVLEAADEVSEEYGMIGDGPFPSRVPEA